MLVRALTSLRRNGVVGTIRWQLYRLSEAYNERHLGVDTRRSAEFGPNAYCHLAEHTPYEPLPYGLIKRGLGSVCENAQEHVFLDFGSGMGRVVLTAARHPFKRVIGVELMKPLCEIARENVARANHKLRSSVEIVNEDATRYEVPDDVTVIHLFNPFTGDIMTAVQRRIRESLERAPRHVRIIYAHPTDQRNLFEGVEWVKEKQRISTGVFFAMKLLVYEHTPSQGAASGTHRRVTPEAPVFSAKLA
jgi:16S rRNA G966 N2-methylase RsmD